MSSVDLTSKAYRHLHQQLVTGKLGSGTVISEKKLAADLGISRTPVGEAFRQLVAEGLVEQIPRYGTVVKTFTRQDVAEIYELREAIEPYAACKAARSISKLQLQQLGVLCRAIEQLAEQLDASDADSLDGETLRQFMAADMAFHLLIVRAAANSRILKVVQDSRVVSQVFHMRRPRHDSTIVHGACDFHKKILTGLRSGDADAAADWMLKHIRQSKQVTLAFVDQERDICLLPGPDFALELKDDIRSELERLEIGRQE